MNAAMLKEAASIRFPMNRIIGNWWASGENDVQIAGAEAEGYLGAVPQAPGAVCPVHDDVLKYVYNSGKAAGSDFKPRAGEVLYNRGLTIAMWTAEAIAKAMELRNSKYVTPADIRDGMEALDITEERIEKLGFEGMLAPVKVTCSNHEGPGRAAIQEWDAAGNKWRLMSGFYEAEGDAIKPLLEAGAGAQPAENKSAQRACK